MKELKTYYDEWKKKLLYFSLITNAALVLLFSYLDNVLSRLLESLVSMVSFFDNQIVFYVINLIVGYIAPTSISIGLYFYLLNCVNTKWWKKKFPQYDIDGEWDDNTVYTRQFTNNGAKKVTNTSVPSPVRIYQTCTSIKIEPSVGQDFMWRSLMAEWDANEALMIFYEVEYYSSLQQKNGYPQNRRGYEYMTIDRSNSNMNKKPQKLVGQFWHCVANDGKPIYMGDVTYTRKLTH